MPKSLGIIGGTGKQGTALAKRLVKHNYPVRIGSRSEDRGKTTAEDMNEELSTSLVTGGTNEYATKADIIVLAIPFDQIDVLLTPLSHYLDGKLIIDMTVNLSFGNFINANLYQGKSSYEYVQEKFSDSDVVACLKTISFTLLGEDKKLDQTDFQMTLSDEAYQFTSDLVSKFGLNPIRVRGKTHAHTIERMVAMSIQLNKEYSGSHIGYKITNLNR